MINETEDWAGVGLAAGRYQVRQKLGEGGMGCVYKAWDTKLGADVVVKAPRRAILAAHPGFAQRFSREIRSLVRLSHPHIVKISDIGEHEGLPFAVMQYLPGGTLEERRPISSDGQPGPMPLADLRSWLREIAVSLDFIHGKGYVHRDIKPANIFFDAENNVYLGDFGIAKVVADQSAEQGPLTLTGTGMLLGTPQYIAPEVAAGNTYDGRADQYSLAVMIHTLLCGRCPFNGPTVAAILLQQSTATPPNLHSLIPSIPEGVAKAVLRSLQRQPDARWPNCSSFADAFFRATEQVDIERHSQTRHLHPSPDRVPSPPESRGAASKRPPIAEVVPKLTPFSEAQSTGDAVVRGRQWSRHGWRWLSLAAMLAALTVLVIVLLVVQAIRNGRPATGDDKEVARVSVSDAENESPVTKPVSTTNPAIPDSAASLLSQADELAKLGRYDEAIDLYTKVVAIAPRLAAAYCRRGMACLSRSIRRGDDQWSEAIDDFDHALRLNPEYVEAYAGRAVARAWNKDLSAAKSDAQEALWRDPKNAFAHCALGDIACKEKAFERAISEYNRALQLTPGFALAYHRRGRAYSQMMNRSAAIPDYTEAIRLDPYCAEAYKDRGWAYHDRNQYDKAIEDYNEAIRLDPALCGVYNLRGLAYDSKKEFDRAIRDYKSGIRIEPSNPVLHFNRGAACYSKGDYDQAIASFTDAVRLRPRYTAAYNRRGNVYYAKNEYDKAARDYRKAIEIEPTNANYHANLGGALLKNHDYDGAIASFTESIRLDPRKATSYNRRGNAYYQKEKYDEAVADYRKACQLDPDKVLYHYNLGMTLVLKDAYDEGIASLDKVLQLDPDYTNAYNQRGNAYLYKRQYKTALKDYRKAATLRPGYAVYHFNLANCQLKMGAHDDAIACASEAIRLNPNYASAYTKRAEAYKAKGLLQKAEADLEKARQLTARQGSK